MTYPVSLSGFNSNDFLYSSSHNESFAVSEQHENASTLLGCKTNITPSEQDNDVLNTLRSSDGRKGIDDLLDYMMSQDISKMTIFNLNQDSEIERIHTVSFCDRRGYVVETSEKDKESSVSLLNSLNFNGYSDLLKSMHRESEILISSDGKLKNKMAGDDCLTVPEGANNRLSELHEINERLNGDEYNKMALISQINTHRENVHSAEKIISNPWSVFNSFDNDFREEIHNNIKKIFSESEAINTLQIRMANFHGKSEGVSTKFTEDVLCARVINILMKVLEKAKTKTDNDAQLLTNKGKMNGAIISAYQDLLKVYENRIQHGIPLSWNLN